MAHAPNNTTKANITAMMSHWTIVGRSLLCRSMLLAPTFGGRQGDGEKAALCS